MDTITFISQPELDSYRPVHRDLTAENVQDPGVEVGDVIANAIRG